MYTPKNEVKSSQVAPKGVQPALQPFSTTNVCKELYYSNIMNTWPNIAVLFWITRFFLGGIKLDYAWKVILSEFASKNRALLGLVSYNDPLIWENSLTKPATHVPGSYWGFQKSRPSCTGRSPLGGMKCYSHGNSQCASCACAFVVAPYNKNWGGLMSPSLRACKARRQRGVYNSCVLPFWLDGGVTPERLQDQSRFSKTDLPLKNGKCEMWHVCRSCVSALCVF